MPGLFDYLSIEGLDMFMLVGLKERKKETLFTPTNSIQIMQTSCWLD